MQRGPITARSHQPVAELNSGPRCHPDTNGLWKRRVARSGGPPSPASIRLAKTPLGHLRLVRTPARSVDGGPRRDLGAHQSLGAGPVAGREWERHEHFEYSVPTVGGTSSLWGGPTGHPRRTTRLCCCVSVRRDYVQVAKRRSRPAGGRGASSQLWRTHRSNEFRAY
jgi:hypothetical protein